MDCPLDKLKQHLDYFLGKDNYDLELSGEDVHISYKITEYLAEEESHIASIRISYIAKIKRMKYGFATERWNGWEFISFTYKDALEDMLVLHTLLKEYIESSGGEVIE